MTYTSMFMTLFSLILYMALFWGLFLIFLPSVIRFMKEFRKKTTKKKKKNGFLKKHISSMLGSLYGIDGEQKSDEFLFFLGTLLLLSFFLLKRQLPWASAFLFALIMSAFPYLFLRVRIYAVQVNGSYEGEFFVSELLNQYKINHLNMLEALAVSVEHLKNCPHVQKQLFRLSIKLKVYGTEEEAQEAINSFASAVNTEWGRILANNIFLSVHQGYDVTSGLEDILVELKRAQSVYEQGLRNTSEGFVMVKYILPGLYIGTIYMAVHYFDFSLRKFFTYQFFTPLGLKLFCINVVLFLLNVLLMNFFKKRKFDVG